MMRKLFVFGTSLFWLALLAFWGAGSGWREAPAEAKPLAGKARYSLAEVARHNQPDDCWMVIGGQVYEISAYLPDHPSRPGLVEPWCGQEASEAYRTKTKGRPHSSAADQVLSGFRIGQLVP